MRQGGDLRRQPQRRERLSNMRLPGAGTLQARLEPIGLPELKSHHTRRFGQPLRRDSRTPDRKDALLLSAQGVESFFKRATRLLSGVTCLVRRFRAGELRRIAGIVS